MWPIIHRVSILLRVQKERRVDQPVFDYVVEVEGGDDPTYTVVRRVGATVDELLEHGRATKVGKRAPLPTDGVQEVGLRLCHVCYIGQVTEVLDDELKADYQSYTVSRSTWVVRKAQRESNADVSMFRRGHGLHPS